MGLGIQVRPVFGFMDAAWPQAVSNSCGPNGGLCLDDLRCHKE